ncbi:N-acetylglucosamine-6-phosphate deacetylase protein [Marine Group I thaumarchaeote SCGC AAA799-P11]|uniref:N-acetylglucosamine-6-phosphate deacetylase protein n=1 Tax=Marine Group I thaumarchaeote SCGC AAA799-P11 TaxID=1502295 RepID=A0A087RZB9_9ARCH|nr:N-acetylglucosamine-6-phosphate deacetylase protein [Marine Group I thaumarchaeote SCGC AAA799-P11]
MHTKNYKYALLLVAAVSITAAGAMSQAYAQSVEDGMDGYVKGTSGIYTGNPNECWFDDGEGGMLPCMIDTGDTAWMLTATSLVLFMSPGVAFFYGGLARSKNVVNVLGMTLIVMGLMSVQWVLWGYSLAFAPNADEGANMFMGSLDYAGFNMVSAWAPIGELGPCHDTWSAAYQMNEFKEGEYCSQSWPGTVPHQMFAMFQGTFAIITPILIIGGLIDRIKFSALVIFVLLWGTFVYDPIAHWVWGGGFIGGGALDLDPDLSPTFALDFAGGTVVHISSGFAALAGALILGRRLGYGKVPMEPHNIPMVVLGASILWFGWFGFNAGSEVMVDGITVSAWTVTNTATGMAAVTWVLMSWAHTGKPSIVGAASGAVAGLVTITPASGWVGPMAAIIMGIAAGTVCYASVAFKNARKWDDALDVWGIHGMGGLTGAILTGTLASPHVWDTGDGIGAWTGTAEGMEQQAISIIGAAVSIAYAFGITIVILKVMDAVWPGGIRVTPKEEEIGLDLAQHGERAYVNE